MSRRILVVAPHADDEVLGCGGLIAQHARNGGEVFVSVMTNASVGAPELFSSEEIELIRKEAKEAHALLGVTDTFFFDFPAPALEQFPQYQIASALSELLTTIVPHTLLVPHYGDLHMDHGAIFNASLVAARPHPGSPVREVLAYETLSETEWGHPVQGTSFLPNHFVELSNEDIQAKLDAMEKFESQLCSFPHPRSLKAIQALAWTRGATVGVENAEAYMHMRTVVPLGG